MSMDEDQELLQDFLVEAGEILEQLGEQLVDLENRPDDNGLLNAVFRGFHTIKGGASFLSLDNMVALCHRAEDVFNVLRNGERKVDVRVMDVILPVLDNLNEQFDEVRAGEKEHAADPALLAKLDQLALPDKGEDSVAPAAVPEPVPAVVAAAAAATSDSEDLPGKGSDASSDGSDNLFGAGATSGAAGDSDEITDEEFEKLLDTLEAKDKPGAAEPVATAAVHPSSAPAKEGDISEDEFESLLDQLPGARKGGADGAVSPGSEPAAPEPDRVIQPNGAIATDKDITENEFDALLDELHGVGKHSNSVGKQPVVSAVPAAAVEKPATASAAAEKPKPPEVKAREAQPQAETTVRVDTKRLDDIMNMVGELVLVRNRMATLDATKNDEEMSKVVANLDVVTADLQAAVMKTRMQPIKKVFGRFPRVVRDLARNLNKEVNLELQGEETDLDKNLVEALADPLVHLVRNAVDHGIESPEERVAKGKPRSGTVILTAEQEGDHILLTIEDDGKGMDPDALRKSAVKKGMMDEEAASRLEPKDCFNLIFQPGFSTKDEISDVSGRGVGMDVVKTRIVQLNGSVEIDSRIDKGSVIIIKVPLTLAIMPTLMVMLKSQIFALPLASVNEIFHLDLTRTNVVDGQLCVMVRDKALPLFYLKHWLVRGSAGEPLPKEGHVVVVSMGVRRIGFVVDTLIGQEEVVIKPLGALLHGMRGLAGATITGDGRISLILDIPGLMYTYARRVS